MEILPKPLSDRDVEERLEALANTYMTAGRLGITILNHIGGNAETLLGRLPDKMRAGLEGATSDALHMALDAADKSRGVVPEGSDWLNRAVTTAMGAAGGFAGLPGALAELPVTTTVLMRAIQDVATAQGFDRNEEAVRFDCLQVFAAAGPFDHDDGADLGFVAARMTLTGGAMQKLIAQVAPKLAAALGQKLAAQTVPVLGAVAGAGINYTYTRYYQDMAHVHFGLRRLAIDGGIEHTDLLKCFAKRVKQPPVKRAG